MGAGLLRVATSGHIDGVAQGEGIKGNENANESKSERVSSGICDCVSV